MDYYQDKVLQDRESHLIGAGISFIIMAPLCGIVAGAFLLSAAAFYAVTGLFVLFGILGIIGGIKEKVERKRNFNS
jgi:hypothetical protein